MIQKVSMVVACRNASGEPDLFFCEVEADPNTGDHVLMALAEAEEHGYEGPMIVADEFDSLYQKAVARRGEPSTPAKFLVTAEYAGGREGPSGYYTFVGTAQSIARYLVENEHEVLVASLPLDYESVKILTDSQYQEKT